LGSHYRAIDSAEKKEERAWFKSQSLEKSQPYAMLSPRDTVQKSFYDKYPEYVNLCKQLGDSCPVPSSAMCVWVAFITGIVSLCIGCVLPMFTTTTYGIIGMLQDFGIRDRVQHYALMGLPWATSHWLMERDVWPFAAVLCVFSLIAPMVRAITCGLLWTVTWEFQSFRRLVRMAQLTLTALYFEVCLLTSGLVVALAGTITYQVNKGLNGEVYAATGPALPSCSTIPNIVDDHMSLMSKLGLISEDDSNILYKRAELQAGAWFLVLSVVLIGVPSMLITWRATAYLEELEDPTDETRMTWLPELSDKDSGSGSGSDSDYDNANNRSSVRSILCFKEMSDTSELE